MKKLGLLAAMGFATETEKKKRTSTAYKWRGKRTSVRLCTLTIKRNLFLLFNDTERTATTSNIERCEPRNAGINRYKKKKQKTTIVYYGEIVRRKISPAVKVNFARGD